MDLLPLKNKLEGTDTFIRESYLGMKELKNCVFAEYKEKKKTYQIFIMVPAGGETNDDVWNRLEQKWKQTESKGRAILFRKTPYKGYIGLIRTSKGLLGITHADNEKKLKKQLVKFAGQ